MAQFHFHSPSEHTVAGKHTDMEAHLVHRDAAGTLAVIGVLLQKGRELRGLKTVWSNLPQSESEKSGRGPPSTLRRYCRRKGICMLTPVR